MIRFCEECGKKISLMEDDSDQQDKVARCSGCNEMILLSGEAGAIALPVMNADSAPLISSQVNVLVVDDSKLIRKAIADIMDSDGGIHIAGEAENGAMALEMIPKIRPDVVTLDINMPVMDGLTALKHIMIKYPTPTVMFSTLTREGALETFDSLKYGAIDFLQKPSQLREEEIEDQFRKIAQKVKNAATVEINTLRFLRVPKSLLKEKTISNHPLKTIYAIGASEGGYNSLLDIIPQLKPDQPAAYIGVLYAESSHIDAFVHYLEHNSLVRVRRAKDNQQIENGTCYLASGSEYVSFDSSQDMLTLRISSSPFPDRRGSINMMMISLADTMKEKAAGIILSGVGDDGGEGLSEIIRMGGASMIQDPKTCLFKDMSRFAIEKCSSAHVFRGSQIAEEMNNLYQ